MAGLEETTARLAAARRAPSPAVRMMPETRGFGSNPGHLRMLSFIPEGLSTGAPLVVALHGCTQHGEAFAALSGWLELARREGFAVLAPEQTAANNPNLCFNWFNPDDVRRGEGEAASIAAMIAHMVAAHGLDPERIFVTGLSAGGAMTAVMLAAYPERFAGGAVIAGLPFGAAGSVQEGLAAMAGRSGKDAAALADALRAAAPRPGRIPKLAIWHGGADAVVSVSNANLLAGQWSAAYGLSQAPDATGLPPGGGRAVWRGADGQPAMELVILPAMGHGSPLATLGEHGLGEVAPFMLEAGVSSTLEIARFWGLVSAGDAPGLESAASHGDGRHSLGEKVMAGLAELPEAVQSTVAKALRASGLLD